MFDRQLFIWPICLCRISCDDVSNSITFNVFTVFLYCFVYVYLFLFVTSARTTATEGKLNCSK
jgi:hypothetical protein